MRPIVMISGWPQRLCGIATFAEKAVEFTRKAAAVFLAAAWLFAVAWPADCAENPVQELRKKIIAGVAAGQRPKVLVPIMGRKMRGTICTADGNGIRVELPGKAKPMSVAWQEIDPKTFYSIARKFADTASLSDHRLLLEYCRSTGLDQEAAREKQAVVSLGGVEEKAAAPVRPKPLDRRKKRKPPAKRTPAARSLKDFKHPFIACTPEELQRLRAAYNTGGRGGRNVVARVVSRGESALRREPEFPPRGGQHNQWYQCDKCQVALKTVDDTHHKCPKCGKVYSGEPYDDVIFSRKHSRNFSDCSSAAWAYAITGERKYAEHAAKILLGYAERYTKYPYHSASRNNSSWTKVAGGHVFEQTLNEASIMPAYVAAPYDLIHDSGVLSAADHAAIRDKLILPMLENMEKNHAGKSNWQSWHNAGMLWGGAVIGDESWVKKAIDDPENGFMRQMVISISDDGMWYENSWGYHFYTLSALVKTAEGARRLGRDLWSDPKFKKMFTLPVHYSMPDGYLPRFGDDVNTTVSRQARFMECAYASYRDPAILALLPETPSWESVMLGRDTRQKAERAILASEVFSSAGHAIIRTKGRAGLAAAITFGPYGGFHGHFDKLSFVFFGLGRELGVDPGRAKSQAYRLPIHRNWYKATVSHNTVLVDGASQKPAEGKLELFASNDQYTAVSASCDAAYAGVSHQRTLLLTPTYLLIADRITAKGDRRFDWIYHNRGSGVSCEAAKEAGQLDKPFTGAEYIQNVKAGSTGELIRVRFDGKGIATYLTAAGEPGTVVTVGDGVGASVFDRVPLAVITRKGHWAHFACVLEPVAEGARPTVTGVAWSEQAGVLTVVVKRGRASDTLKLAAGNQLIVKTGKKTVLSTGRR